MPFEENSANWNEGLKTNPTDDKGSYVYGEKQLSYIQKIETKTHVALFFISPRKDGFGVQGEEGGLGTSSKMYKLDKVELYSIGEFEEGTTDANGNITATTNSTPIKTVHFVYDYELCQGIENNDLTAAGGNELDNQGGKLTLKKVYFTYRNSAMGKYSPYSFTYCDDDHDPGTSTERNPNYNLKGYDIWGNYKPNNGTTANETTDPLSAPEFNYVEQNTVVEKNKVDDYTAAWSLSDIQLPSGGKIKVDYESDDYQYIQDKKAMRMFKLAGTGECADPTAPCAGTPFGFAPGGSQANNEGLLFKGTKDAKYLYFQLDEEDQSIAEPITEEDFKKKYLQEIIDSQQGLVQFRVFMNMTRKGGKVSDGDWIEEPFDFVTGYFELDPDLSSIFSAGSKKYGSVGMRLVKMEGGFGGAAEVNPIAKTGWHFGRKYLSRYVYNGESPDAEAGLGDNVVNIVKNLVASVVSLGEIFSGPNGALKGLNIGRRIVLDKSWIRLSEPTTAKKGGGCRVKQLVMTDEWATMTGEPSGGITDQKYGQEYEYKLVDGGSSGVATYEPVGSKENPLVQPVFVNVNRLLAPDEENYIEKPFGESFFPSPTVTYGRVSVKNIERVDDKGTPGDMTDDRYVVKHATGKVVTEFYTSKDFPTITDQTRLDIREDHNPLLANLLKVNVVRHLTLSQGYMVHLNDMNGKMKKQEVFAEGQDAKISGVEYNYDLYPGIAPDAEDVTDPRGRLNNQVVALDANGGLKVTKLGVEYTIINDFREMRSRTYTVGVNYNTAGFPLGPLPVIVPTPLPDFARHINQLRLATTTKIVNSYGIVKETIAYDAGASVKTRNILWDAETGEVLATETVNEFDDKYYSFNYPAHWAYKGMGQAAFNSGLSSEVTHSGTGFTLDAKDPGKAINSYLSLGDELLYQNSSGDVSLAWVNELIGSSVFKLIKTDGTAVSPTDGKIKVIRSGRRNIQSTSMGSVVLMKNPVSLIQSDGGELTGNFMTTLAEPDLRVVNAGAVEFSDNWAAQCECGVDVLNGVFNPYRYNTKGVWRAKSSYLYLTGRKATSGDPNTRNDGFYNEFEPYHYKDAIGNWFQRDLALSKWTFTSEVTTFSPYGFELENADALGRKSAAQYGYNHSFPLSVVANTGYSEMGYDGFEDYNFDGCEENEHFGFKDVEPGNKTNLEDEGITNLKSHTGRFSMKVAAGNTVIRTFTLNCNE